MENKKNLLLVILSVIVLVSVGADLVGGYFEQKFHEKLSSLSERYDRSSSDEEKQAIIVETSQVAKYPYNFMSSRAISQGDDACWDYAWNGTDSITVVMYGWEYSGWLGRLLYCING